MSVTNWRILWTPRHWCNTSSHWYGWDLRCCSDDVDFQGQEPQFTASIDEWSTRDEVGPYDGLPDHLAIQLVNVTNVKVCNCHIKTVTENWCGHTIAYGFAITEWDPSVGIVIVPGNPRKPSRETYTNFKPNSAWDPFRVSRVLTTP